ncbi:myosin light chain kinase, smooth muscle-like [Lingula anatina]|uniref:Myosin light chain kinase, smooth muscle-like n=1 Tax=Lingula anatina TaxID=7574 RepID=A0A1S3ISK2_LINAN|nr:myosin light chain kinase, smooth muscle-like [Lingula anatina]|eukprot:XP_013401053.1 myosin light chain kinase, smooth muscle-like [Lingula anatina]
MAPQLNVADKQESVRTPELLRSVGNVRLELRGDADKSQTLENSKSIRPNLKVKLSQIRHCSIKDIKLDSGPDDRATRIGMGDFGTVFRATHVPSGDRVAVKFFKRDENTRRDILVEARVLEYLNGAKLSPKFYGVVNYGEAAVAETEFSPLAVVTEFVSIRQKSRLSFHYEEFRKFRSTRRHLTATDWLRFGMELAEGLQEIHEMGIGIFDIKHENIMVQRDSKGRIHPRIVDFGAAFLLNDDKPYLSPNKFTLEMLKQLRPMSEQLAPEIFEFASRSAALDVYSLGFVFGDMARRAKVLGLRDLAAHCMADDPTRRPCLPDVIGHLKRLLKEEKQRRLATFHRSVA